MGMEAREGRKQKGDRRFKRDSINSIHTLNFSPLSSPLSSPLYDLYEYCINTIKK